MSRIAIGHHEIGRVLSGTLRFFLRRDAGTFRKLEPGDALWLAEPFHLERRFDGRCPTAARYLGARPVFAGDHPKGPPPGYGKRHPARALCRAWHRSHLLIESRAPLRLHDLPDADLIALGLDSRAAFAVHWDRESSLIGGRGLLWRDNPLVLRFGFALVRAPLPGEAEAPPPRERPGAWREPVVPPPPARPTGTCPRCGTRLAVGCRHAPLEERAA